MAKRIGLHARNIVKENCAALKEIVNTFLERKANLYHTEYFAKQYQRFFKEDAPGTTFTRDQELPEMDFFISMGGDGTLLDTITYIKDRDIPIVGINLGRLGFLATITTDQLQEAVDALYQEKFVIDERTLIRMDANTDVFGETNFALNEFAIQKRDTSSMIVVHTYINGEFLNAYWSDGLIVSTPTGSTGYSMSCGGPLVLPHSHNFIITPIAPHNLNVRPMVVSDDSTISFEITGRAKNFLVSLDSRSRTVDENIEIVIRKQHFKIKLVKLPSYNFFDTLRNKLNWGLDARN